MMQQGSVNDLLIKVSTSQCLKCHICSSQDANDKSSLRDSYLAMVAYKTYNTSHLRVPTSWHQVPTLIILSNISEESYLTKVEFVSMLLFAIVSHVLATYSLEQFVTSIGHTVHYSSANSIYLISQTTYKKLITNLNYL